MSEYPQASGAVDAVSPDELADRLRAGDPVSVLDVRNRADSEAWPLSGETVTTYHVPYYRFVEANVNGTVDSLGKEVREALDEPIVVICGRGEASAYVAELLEETGVDAANLDGGMRGWARVYHAVEVDVDSDATVVQYQRPSSGCLAYLVVSGAEALVIDPLRAFTDRYVADAREEGAELVAAVDTHVHADHVSGVRELARETDAEVLLPRGARERGLAFDARLVEAGDAVAVGGAELDAVALPGHTTEMLGFELADLLFAGDTVFLESVARPDLEAGDEGAPDAARRLHDTLSTLDDDRRIAPAHFSDAARPDESGAYVARMSDLRERLRALSLSREEFVEYVLDDMPPRPANYEEIITVNLGLDRVDDDESFELELGPNNCAATRAVDAD
ncbi:MBL fold metallo-hydrolase [Salinigranum sp. GCM10025319]|uniref:MBL fold metallo-hydrolase n=1 Tax=Salinigranum sp. GCM10025319 TaxID=3252687 RepID=UPI00361A212C